MSMRIRVAVKISRRKLLDEQDDSPKTIPSNNNDESTGMAGSRPARIPEMKSDICRPGQDPLKPRKHIIFQRSIMGKPLFFFLFRITPLSQAEQH
jgi:hypothetical protein